MTKRNADITTEGVKAFANGEPVSALPYANFKPQADAWLHGWWGAYYQQQKNDIEVIMNWIDNGAYEIYSESHAKAIAEIAVHTAKYDRCAPIEVRVGAIQFTIPAPASLTTREARNAE